MKAVGRCRPQTDRQTDTAQGIVDDGQDIITESVWTTRMSCQVNSSSSSRAQFFLYFISSNVLWQLNLRALSLTASFTRGSESSVIYWHGKQEIGMKHNNWIAKSMVYSFSVDIRLCAILPHCDDWMTDWLAGMGWDGMALVLNSNHIPIDDTKRRLTMIPFPLCRWRAVDNT